MSSENDPAYGLRVAFDLFDAAEALLRQNILREFPESTDNMATVPGFRVRLVDRGD